MACTKNSQFSIAILRLFTARLQPDYIKHSKLHQFESGKFHIGFLIFNTAKENRDFRTKPGYTTQQF
jgi:hypothetical protein